MRDPDLSRFLAAVDAALEPVAMPLPDFAQAVRRRMDRVVPGQSLPAVLPVCAHLTPLITAAGTPLALTFATLIPRLHWARRPSARPTDGPFWEGHANATILGPGGLETHDDLWLGATVMAPGTVYPEHSHPPEEIYFPLAPGEWCNEVMGWTDPGPGGFIHNPPDIRHSMRAGKGAFLTIWVLPR